MSRKKRAGATATNENWVRTETTQEYRNNAQKALADVKRYEAAHSWRAIRIDNKTVILKRNDTAKN